MARRRTRELSPAEKLHADWLGMIQPQGLVVSIPVLVEAAAYSRQETAVQARIRALAPEGTLSREGFFDLLQSVLGWKAKRLQTQDLAHWSLAMPDLGIEIAPDAALVSNKGEPLILVRWSDAPAGDGDAFDQREEGARFPLSRQAALERLLVELQRSEGEGTPIALHACPDALRLTYAPRGEAPGSLTFPLDALLTWDGRILVDALLMLVGHDRLFTVPSDQRLLALLRRSRERQEEVTNALAGQVQDALRILVEGFNVADQRMKGRLLADWRDAGDDGTRQLREGLTSVILRLVFLLYCEDARDAQGRGILPLDNPLYAQSYSVGGLASALSEERVRFSETMHSRYGGWAQLCALFRLVFDGVYHKQLFLPPRQGELFDPARFPFLEGRGMAGSWTTEGGEVPPIDDGVVDGVLENLVFLEGQRVSYRNLDVEQLGSVYEALMELDLHRAQTIAFRLQNGTILERWQLSEADRPLDVLAAALGRKNASDLTRRDGIAAKDLPTTPDGDWYAALAPVLAKGIASPVLPAGSLYLQGGSERRQTGSHYTPQALTSRIVARTLDPVVGEAPTAEKILSLKVCDLAMGSGAFLAEACRYLARKLREAWTREGNTPAEAATTDPELIARRMVAERCLYGVDKNPFAVNLARLSLWLVTLSRDLPFTFIDHALAEGDSVIGVSPQHIEAFSLESKNRQLSIAVRKAMQSAERARRNIHSAQQTLWREKSAWLRDAHEDVKSERVLGDILLAIAWAEKSASKQRKLRDALHMPVMAWYTNGGEGDLPPQVQELCEALPMRPFHWNLEFPEVFLRDNPGFDAIVGNPPFLGGKSIKTVLTEGYPRLLLALQPHTHGNADLVAQFIIRASQVLRKKGCFGLIATNTVKQGDTKSTGLQYVLNELGFSIYNAEVDIVWPVSGGASVVVDIIHSFNGAWAEEVFLNGVLVENISSSLSDEEEYSDPEKLKENADKSFVGSFVLGTGFVLDEVAAKELLEREKHYSDVVRPYIGGEDLNSNLVGTDGFTSFGRYVISFFDRSESESKAYTDPFRIVEEQVKPERTRIDPDGNFVLRKPLPQRWWQFADKRPALYAQISNIERCISCSMVSKYLLFSFQPTNRIFSHKVCVIALSDWADFSVLQSVVHESWAWKLSSTLHMRLNYTPSTCFETFPFPRPTNAQRAIVEAAGEAFDKARTACMRTYAEGMTKVWNRVMDPANEDEDIVALRRLKREMDEAVLTAYGWGDLSPEDTKEIVRRLRALNATRFKGKPDPKYGK